MAGRISYPWLSNISDPAIRQAMVSLLTRVGNLEGQEGGAPKISKPLSLVGNKITDVGDPVAAQDVVTKAYADANYGAAAQQVNLQVGGTNPLNVTQLLGAGSQVTLGTHAQRVVAPPTNSASVWVETDRLAIYRANTAGTAWVLVGNFLGSGDLTANRPADLGAPDDSYYFYSVDEGVVYRWTGSVWRLHAGILTDTFANRPLVSGCDVGACFCASDYGYAVWEYQYTPNAWVLIAQLEPMQGTLAIPALGLGAHDVGFEYGSTDYDRCFRWNGSGWEDALGQPERLMYVDFQGAAPAGNGWVAADGGSHTISTSAGGTTSYTTNLVANNYVRG